MRTDNSLLLVAPLYLRMSPEGKLEIEAQAANGLRMWAKHFSKVTLCALLRPETLKENIGTISWVKIDSLKTANVVECIPLPWAYHPIDYLRNLSGVRKKLSGLISKNQYLQFGIGGCTFGDWAAVGARMAYNAGRDYSVHTDAVSHMQPLLNKSIGLNKKARAYFDHITMLFFEKPIITRAKLGLFHGAECFDFYKDYCRNAYMIHDIHVASESLPTMDIIRKKVGQVYDRPLRIIYAGRMHPIKAPDQWINVLNRLKKAGVKFEAKWLGDGPMFDEMQTKVSILQLSAMTSLRGFVADRGAVLSELRAADILMFCHLSPESPRILIESLNQGTPIIGYKSRYPADLIHDGGGLLVEQGNEEALFRLVMSIDKSRTLLSRLVEEAAKAGQNLTDENVFAHRANLIKSVLV